MSDKPLIMVVEDDMEMNELQRELLALHDMESIPAYSGAEAVRLQTDNPVDGVLLDIMLPEMDGYETCQHIRARENGQHVPIVMLTALDTEECRHRGFAAGADAYFIKPFDPDEVITSLKELIAEFGRNG